jgi:hypothetical protein
MTFLNKNQNPGFDIACLERMPIVGQAVERFSLPLVLFQTGYFKRDFL